MRELVIVGAGGFGRETLDVVRVINGHTPTWRVLGFVDDNLSSDNAARLNTLGVPFLGTLQSLPNGAPVAVAIGNPKIRAAVVQSLAGRHNFPALVHPQTIRGSEVHHGDGLIVLGGVSIGTNVQLGNHVHLNAHAVIGHDSRILDFVSVNPNATISGECTVGPRTLIGASSTVLQQVIVGADSVVGAAACVVKDVPERAVATGIPAQYRQTHDANS